MTKKTNKEIILELTKYFMQQPQELICKMLACMMIDFNRMYNVRELSEKERENLMWRIEWNIDQLNKFIKDGPDGSLKMENADHEND